MAKNKISEFSSTPANNTDIGGINIAEGCAPSGINNAIRELMAQLKDQQAGTDGDGFIVGGAFTCTGAAVFSSTVAVTGNASFSNNVSANGNVTLGNDNTDAHVLNGTLTAATAGKIRLDDSVTTASAPVLSFDGDTDTGIYRPAANTIGLATGGSERLRVDSSGNVGIGVTPTQKLHVSGNILSTGSIDAGTQFLGQASDTVSAPSFSWTGDTNCGIYRPAADTIGVVTAGVERMRVNSSGNVDMYGTLAVTGASTLTGALNLKNNIVFEGATDDAFETTLTVVDPTADRTITLPDATTTVVGTGVTQTLTNKTIALGSNTVSGTAAQFDTACTDTNFVFDSDFTSANQSKTSNGYQKFPGGLIIQWGVDNVDIPGDGKRSYTFPIGFPTNCATVQVTIFGDQSRIGDDKHINLFTKSKTGFEVESMSESVIPGITWLAVGY